MTGEVDLHHVITGDGQPVVFTHGWLNTGSVWDGTVEHLGSAVRSLRWDLRGHGQSGAADPGSYERVDALADLTRMVDAAGVPAILVGHSLGGYLSLAQAIEQPEQVAGLVLVAAGPGFRNPEAREQWNDSVRAIAAKNDDLPTGVERLSMHVDSLVLDRLGEINVPVATVIGERDTRFLASADVFDKYLDVRHRVVVPDAGHMVHAKQPGVIAEAVRTVLAALD
ncbi:MAG: alpha/beta hydrolase [Actinomycetota bacterium]